MQSGIVQTRPVDIVSVDAMGSVAKDRWTQSQRPPAFRGSTVVVPVYATVREQGGRLVPDLTKDDFRILDNGKPVEITTFSNEVQPFTTVLLLDMSNSMVPKYQRVLDSAERFVKSILPADRIRIGTFGREVAISPLLTGDKAILARILDEEVWPGGATPLWRASTAAMDSLASETGRRVVLVITDGADSGGDYNCAPVVSDPHGSFGACPSRRDVQEQAQNQDFMFYAIGLQGTGLDQGIRDVSDRTGGGHFELSQTADLDATFARVADELHHQYLLGFSPAVPDGKLHQLDVRTERAELVVRARKTYLAEVGR
jgi:VWFA-related protein